jgi:hypothetical protein
VIVSELMLDLVSSDSVSTSTADSCETLRIGEGAESLLRTPGNCFVNG